MEMKGTAFKAYDIRGRFPDEINEEMAYRIGRIFVEQFGAQSVAVGHDIRLSGKALVDALTLGLTEMGCNVFDIGMCGTEQIYFTTANMNLDGGIMVTASHNPKEYNGMKLVRRESRPISADTGLMDIRDKVVSGELPESKADKPGTIYDVNCMPEYVQHLLTYIDTSALKPLKIVVNAGNGAAGPVIDAMEDKLPFTFIKVNHEPDGKFPNGVPNPLLEENREATAKVVREEKADLGVAWDGDFDRCFLFDENGTLVEGYYMVGLLSQAFLAQHKGAKIIYDPRLTWNTIELVEAAGGTPVMCKSGHAFIKERMRKEEAVYGGEMSAHHYFKDFSYCDSGMIPWLLVVELMAKTGKSLAELVQSMTDNYPISGEINSTVEDAKAVLAKIEETYAPNALNIDKTDGLSIAYDNWRFNVRSSNTEPLLRLNVEARGDKALLDEKTQELVALIRG